VVLRLWRSLDFGSGHLHRHALAVRRQIQLLPLRASEHLMSWNEDDLRYLSLTAEPVSK
jgi:hypothetical protein